MLEEAIKRTHKVHAEIWTSVRDRSNKYLTNTSNERLPRSTTLEEEKLSVP